MNILKKLTATYLLAALGLVASNSHAGGLSAKDYMEIQQLYATYNWAIDTGDAQAYANTFTKDGVFNTMQGREQLAGFIDRWVTSMNGSARKHWNSNLHIEGDGKTAKGKVYLLLLDTSVQPAAIVASANYNDELKKTAEGWRFTKRSTSPDRPAAK